MVRDRRWALAGALALAACAASTPGEEAAPAAAPPGTGAGSRGSRGGDPGVPAADAGASPSSAVASGDGDAMDDGGARAGELRRADAGDPDAAPPSSPRVDRCGNTLPALAEDAPSIVDVDTLAFIQRPDALLSPAYWPVELSPGRHAWAQWPPDCAGPCRVDQTAYRQLVFEGSDTTVALLRGTPYALGADGRESSAYAPLSYEDLRVIQAQLREQAPGHRALLAPMVMPNDRLEVQLYMMEQRADGADAWATYTAWDPAQAGGGYWLDDEVGDAFVQKGFELGVPVFLVFKGMPWSGLSTRFTDPRDVGPAAARHPDAHLVVMQAGFEHGLEHGETSAPIDDSSDLGWGSGVGQWPEGPYDEVDAAVQARYPLERGVNSLISSLRGAGIGPGENVYVALGGVWAELMTRPTEAAHVLGKLLLYVGEDRILWGTQSMSYGGPAPQIEAFRSFQIPEPLRRAHGYPELTPTRKAKILAHNATRLFCLQAD